MARLSREEIAAWAEATAALVDPRVVFRKLQDGTMQIVVYHGPIRARQELIFDRTADAATIQAQLERLN